jgi:ABC-type nitrate/sulfonate/bicarbonate transport system substrate-binding protein
MNEASLTKRRPEAVKFLAGEMNGLAYALSHREETIALSREVTGQKADDPRPGWVFDDVLREKAVDATIPLSVERLKGMQDLMVRSGALNKQSPVDQMVDLKLREEALALARR